MKDSEKLREQRTAGLEAAQAIVDAAKAEERDLTDEEFGQVEAHTDKAEQLRTEIEAAEAKEQERLRALARLADEQARDDEIPPPTVRVDPSPHRSRAPAKPRDHEEDSKAGYATFGDFLRDVKMAAFSDADHARLEGRLRAAVTGAGTTVDSELGFLVPPEFSSRILEHMHSVGNIFSLPFMQVALGGNQYEMPYINETSRADGSRQGGVRGYWVGEAEAPTAGEPTVGQLTLKLHKAGCLGYVTEEMVEDYPATGSLLERLFSEELLFKVEDAIVRGDGLKKPMGLKNAACKVAITKETNQTADTLWGPNIVKMWARRNPRGASNNVWLINQDVETYLWGLTLEGRWGSASTDVDGIPLYHPAGSITNQGEFGVLMGRPVIPCEYCDTIGTEGDIILFDPTQYVLATKRGGGVKMDSSIHVRFTQAERTFRAFYRVDGQPWWSAAMTPYQGTNTLTPIITLASRD